MPHAGRKQETDLTPVAKMTLEKRYLRRDEKGQIIETPEEMFRRVAEHVAGAEERYDSDPGEWAERFYSIMAGLEFLPNSPCLMNAGTGIGQLAACFVVPVEDDLDSIFSALREAALIHQSGGGSGFSFSRLRPKGDVVGSTQGVASGPVSFMRVFNAATDEVKQGGRRRGANMAVLSVYHPDILGFVKAKSERGVLENFNLSVALDSEFMRKAVQGGDYQTINPRTGEPCGTLNAGRVLAAMVQEAWRTGEPGLLFLDAVNRDNPTPHAGLIEATNPCGEQPLLPYESCVLGSINLMKMVSSGAVTWDRLRETVRLAVRFLDDVIDVNCYALPEIEKVSKANRKIGLGIMGYADLLYGLGIPYDSDEAVALARKVMREVSDAARRASETLADQRGAFPNFDGSIYDRPGGRRVRNATQTTIAPTGSISLIAGVSSGIEPNFSLAYRRTVVGEETIMVNPVFESVARERGFGRTDLIEHLLRSGSLKGVDGIPEDVVRIFGTAHDIAPEWHVRIQAAFQEQTDNAVSKTVNLRKDCDVNVVKDVFLLAWKLGCKGITVYRDGSRSEQVLKLRDKQADIGQPRERPEKTTGTTKKVRVGCGNLYITVNRDEQGLCEVFTNVGRGGGCPSQVEAASRLVSIALRSGVSPEAIVEQLRGIRCLSTLATKKERSGVEVLSCPDAIGRTILEFLSGTSGRAEPFLRDRCPDCGFELEHESGCLICRSCGFSRCY